MFKTWRLGTLLGFPVEINLSFLLLLAFVYVALGGLAGVRSEERRVGKECW